MNPSVNILLFVFAQNEKIMQRFLHGKYSIEHANIAKFKSERFCSAYFPIDDVFFLLTSCLFLYLILSRRTKVGTEIVVCKFVRTVQIYVEQTTELIVNEQFH